MTTTVWNVIAPFFFRIVIEAEYHAKVVLSNILINTCTFFHSSAYTSMYVYHMYVCMYEWMDEWREGGMSACMYVFMDGWMDG